MSQCTSALYKKALPPPSPTFRPRAAAAPATIPLVPSCPLRPAACPFAPSTGEGSPAADALRMAPRQAWARRGLSSTSSPSDWMTGPKGVWCAVATHAGVSCMARTSFHLPRPRRTSRAATVCVSFARARGVCGFGFLTAVRALKAHDLGPGPAHPASRPGALRAGPARPASPPVVPAAAEAVAARGARGWGAVAGAVGVGRGGRQGPAAEVPEE